MNTQTETLVEYVASGGKLRVDRAAGIIHGVKVLGLESRNGRTYTAAAVERARPLYEGAKVNINHTARPDEGRAYESRLGQIKNVRSDGSGLRADLHFNPKHALAEQLCWDAENAPGNVGLSHNVEARVSRKNGKVIVEEIVSVKSVDLVADPATTGGLHESTGDTAGDKRALVAAIGKELGIPACALEGIGTGPGSFVGEHCPGEAEIREHLRNIRKHLVESGALTDRRQRLATFDRIDGSNPEANADFLEAIGANRPGGAGRFSEAVTGLPVTQNAAALDEALGIRYKRNGFTKAIT